MSEIVAPKNKSIGFGTMPLSKSENEEVQIDDNDDEFDSDPLNYTPTHSNGTIKTSRTLGVSRPKKTRSISPHSRLLRRRRSTDSTTSNDGIEDRRPTVVAVTSCRSDAYYHQKAPGSASKLPQKAPNALKLFHELATGVKDAYDAVGLMPIRPEMDEEGKFKESDNEIILWEFMGNLDFLLALVDEVAVDTATRGALKDDTTFKSIRDVIKKGNKVLETMLVRRERKYTLFFRLATPEHQKQITKMKGWNQKVEKAVGVVTDMKKDGTDGGTGKSERTSIVTRGRLFVKGGTKGRRATPTPRLRNLYALNGPKQMGNAADDGFYAAPVGNFDVGGLKVKPDVKQEEIPAKNQAPVTQENLNKLQNSAPPQNQEPVIATPLQQITGQVSPSPSLSETLNGHMKPAQPKDELVDVIRGLKVEKQLKIKEAGKGNDPSDLKPNWRPKADIPPVVPKLPTEYIHRHRLMKQVVNCLLDQPGAGPRDTDDENSAQCYITSITSRHSDKAGNGKTTLAVAAIQSVEIRERFSDGICWIKLGRRPLTEIDIRSAYEELHCQLLSRHSHVSGEDDENGEDSKSDGSSKTSKDMDEENVHNSTKIPFLGKSRRKFQGGELEGMKEDLYKIICKRKVLICLDDVWSVEDAHWFLFHFKNKGNVIHANMDNEDCQFRILITTRQPGLLGNGNAQEVYVRIFSEHEAVKLLLASAGRRPYGGRNSPVFVESRIIVKGCGNSPLAVRLAGGMLGRLKFWTNHFPIWTALLETCKSSLEEATRLRSFTNAVGLIVDLSFTAIEDVELKVFLRTCFVTFAMVFQSNDRLKNGKGIPKAVVLGLFDEIKIIGRGKENHAGNKKDGNEGSSISSESLLITLEKMHLIEKAKPPVSKKIIEKLNTVTGNSNSFEDIRDAKKDEIIDSGSIISGVMHNSNQSQSKTLVHHEPCYLMHDSIISLAEGMAKRSSSSFAPSSEEESGKSLFTPLRSAANFIAQLAQRGDERPAMPESQFHELMVSSLTNGWVFSPNASNFVSQFFSTSSGSHEVEAYAVEYLPSHLIKAKAYSTAGELLADKKFITKRVSLLGPIDATRRHVSDLIEMKKESSKSPPVDIHPPPPKPVESVSPSHDALEEVSLASSKDGHTLDTKSVASTPLKSSRDFNVSATVRDAARRIIDEIYRIESKNSGSTSLSLTMAFCLSAIGEGLVRCRQAKDAMLRLEEAAGVYRSILGPFHIDVARALNCVAKSLVKLGENRVALLKFGEAASIYNECDATHHFDSISNAQSMASLLVDLGDYPRAEEKYDYVLQLRRTVNGQMSYQVARTHNEYAAILAKQGKLDEAIRQYEDARVSLRGAASLYSGDGDDFDDRFNTTVIDLNIASIKAKKGDIDGAIQCYEVVVEDLQNSRNETNNADIIRSEGAAYSKHIVAAMSRIGSLKLKLRDNSGALEMFEGILKELEGVKDKSTAMKLETARAHIKCATIYRQLRSSTKQAIIHLREALKLYTQIYGPDHRDTRALAASLKQWQQDEVSPPVAGENF